MVRIWPAFVAAVMLGGPASWARAASNGAADSVVEGALLLRCETSQICERLAKAVVEKGATLRQQFKSDIFNGLSIQLPRDKDQVVELESLVAGLKGISGQWPVHTMASAAANDNPKRGRRGNADSRGDENVTSAADVMSAKARDLSRRNRVQAPWEHVMTQVDRLHEEGFTGRGIKIGLVDTGINRAHQAFDPCIDLDRECRVVSAGNHGHRGTKDDVHDEEGHGTKVAGVLMGAAPDATLLVYRLPPPSDEDRFIKAWLDAYMDGAHIITSSLRLLESRQPPLEGLYFVVSRIVAAGVPCIIAAGNSGSSELFRPLQASDGPGVTSVGSVGGVGLRAAYSLGHGSEPVQVDVPMGYETGWAKTDETERRLHNLAVDFADDDVAAAKLAEEYQTEPRDRWPRLKCATRPGLDHEGKYTRDLEGLIALIFKPSDAAGCDFSARAANAVARGAQHILIAATKNQDRLVWFRQGFLSGARALIPPEDGQAMAGALASGKANVTFRIQKLPASGVETAVMSDFSAWGPMWQLETKPNVVAPGELVTLVDPRSNDKYTQNSGTSFAAPLIAGIMALVVQARRLGPDHDPVLLNSLLTSTAQPLRNSHGDGMEPVPKQGAGLVQAWAAAHATTYVLPGVLHFNDTAHRPKSISLLIQNTDDQEKTYELSNLAAPTVYSQTSNGHYPIVSGEAKIHISRTSLTIGAQQSATVEISATDPQHLDSQRLPLWSGWIRIRASDGDNLTVPYLGAAGQAPSPPSPQPEVSGTHGDAQDQIPVVVLSPSEVPEQPRPGPSRIFKYSDNFTVASDYQITLTMKEKPVQTRVDITPLDLCRRRDLTAKRPPSPHYADMCVADSLVKKVRGVRRIAQPEARWDKNKDGQDTLTLSWNGTFAPGKFVPPGRYQFVLQYLSQRGLWKPGERKPFFLLYRSNMRPASDGPGEEVSVDVDIR